MNELREQFFSFYHCKKYFFFFRWKNLVEAGRVVSPASPEELEGEHVPICLFYNQLARDKVVSQFKEK